MNSSDTEAPAPKEVPKKKRKSPTDHGNLVGRRFGKLVVLEKLSAVPYYNSTCPKWRCRWDCGVEKDFRAGQLVHGNAASCGCNKLVTGANHPSWKGVGEVSSSYWPDVRWRASAANLQFNLTIEGINKLLMDQGMKCALSGLPIETQKRSTGTATASLDRIDSAKGYTMDNVQWVHTDVNFMKQDFDQDYFEDLCQKVYETKLRRIAAKAQS